MKKFNRPEFELIVLEDKDVIVTSYVPEDNQGAVKVTYNGRGQQPVKNYSTAADLEDELE